jgi:class 3 adenylate cyclase
MLASVSQPTLVLQPDQPTALGPHAPEHGRYIAENVQRGRFEPLPGSDDVWWAANCDRIADSILRFVADVEPATSADRVSATVAFTDIVSSTEQLVGVGDAAWRSVLDAHDEMVRHRVGGYAGSVVKSTGDGFLLRFDGPARALQCLLDIEEEAANLGVRVRAGVHTGECELRGEDISGVAVHVAARVSAAATAGEVWTTPTVRDLVAGSTLAFDSRGTYELKGLGERELLSARRR